MLEDGEEAPGFELPGAHGGEVSTVRLSDYLGDEVVVLCFYSGDFNPAFERDRWLQDLDLLSLQRNVAVLGIGPDTAWSHRAFADEYSVEFPLLSDVDGSVTADYGVERTYEGHTVPRRAVFVLDDRGVVTYRWVADAPDDAPETERIRSAIADVKSDESAVERYGVAHDYYRYGRSEFDIAHEAFEGGEWSLAVEAFGEAVRYLEHATGELGSAEWFAASDELDERLADAKERVDHFLRAARWYREAASHFADEEVEWAEDYRDDADREHERARTTDPLPDPEDLHTGEDPGGEAV